MTAFTNLPNEILLRIAENLSLNSTPSSDKLGGHGLGGHELAKPDLVSLSLVSKEKATLLALAMPSLRTAYIRNVEESTSISIERAGATRVVYFEIELAGKDVVYSKTRLDLC